MYRLLKECISLTSQENPADLGHFRIYSIHHFRCKQKVFMGQGVWLFLQQSPENKPWVSEKQPKASVCVSHVLRNQKQVVGFQQVDLSLLLLLLQQWDVGILYCIKDWSETHFPRPRRAQTLLFVPGNVFKGVFLFVLWTETLPCLSVNWLWCETTRDTEKL